MGTYHFLLQDRTFVALFTVNAIKGAALQPTDILILGDTHPIQCMSALPFTSWVSVNDSAPVLTAFRTVADAGWAVD